MQTGRDRTTPNPSASSASGVEAPADGVSAKRGLAGLPFAQQEAALAPSGGATAGAVVQRSPAPAATTSAGATAPAASGAAAPLAYTGHGVVQEPSRFVYTEAASGPTGMVTKGRGEVRLPVASIGGGPVAFAGNVTTARLVGVPAGAQGEAVVEGRGAAAIIVIRTTGLTAPSALSVPVVELVTDAGQTVRVPLVVHDVECDTTVVERFQKEKEIGSEQGQIAGLETQAANLAGAPDKAERDARAGQAQIVAYAKATLDDLAHRGERTAALEAHLDAVFAKADEATRANVIAGAAGFAATAGTIPADVASRIQAAGYRVVGLTAKARDLRTEIERSAAAVGLYPAGSESAKRLQATLASKQAELAALEGEMKSLLAEVTAAVDAFALKDERQRATANVLEPGSESRLVDLRDDRKAADQEHSAKDQLAKAETAAATARSTAAAQAAPEAAALQGRIAAARADLARLQKELAGITATSKRVTVGASGG